MRVSPGPEGRKILAHSVSCGNKALTHRAAVPPLPGGERVGVWGTFVHPWLAPWAKVFRPVRGLDWIGVFAAVYPSLPFCFPPSAYCLLPTVFPRPGGPKDFSPQREPWEQGPHPPRRGPPSPRRGEGWGVGGRSFTHSWSLPRRSRWPWAKFFRPLRGLFHQKAGH